MTDTHSHVYMPDAFDDGGVEAVNAALQAGVSRIVLPCVDQASLEPMKALQVRFPQVIKLALGLHPTELTSSWEEDLKYMETLLPGGYAAIGEVGIDLYHDASMRSEQKIAFRRQLEWARQYGLPAIIHCREGLDDTLEVISEVGDLKVPLIFHSFTGTVDEVRRIRGICDPWFGINGVVTFKNAQSLREALPEIGLDHILLETDSPWLAPVPKRGKRNESANILYIRDCVATVLREAGCKAEDGTPIDAGEVERVTDRSAEIIFGF